MKVYTARDVAKLLDLSVHQVRSYARAGLLKPERGPRGEYRFSFQDLVLLRTTKGLMASRIPSRRLRRVLRKLEQQLPVGRPLSGVLISAHGECIVVSDGSSVWNPESGQACFNFEVAELARKVAPCARRVVEQAGQLEEDLQADDWYELGCELEAAAPDQARDAYRRALELEPLHPHARVNLGRLLQEAGRCRTAEAHYRVALAARPCDATILFNLGVCLEEQDRLVDAIAAYLEAVAADPQCADAHYNLARLYEQQGDVSGALRHLRTYRKLTKRT